MNYKFNTALGMLHAEVHPTLEALGDQPWEVRIRSTKGDLLLACFVEDSSALGAAAEAVREVLDLTKTYNKSFTIQ